MIIYFCIEDEISRAVALRLIADYCPPGIASVELGKAFGGNGHIKANFRKYFQLAQHHPVFVITDLDREACPPSLRSKWLQAANLVEPLPDRMLFCIAQTEIESWLLADKDGISNFLNVNSARISSSVESSIRDAKEYLVEIARTSKSSEVRDALVPYDGSRATVGLSYNFKLSSFVKDVWQPSKAAESSTSLHRTIGKLSHLNV
jgi:hypothetical protein